MKSYFTFIGCVVVVFLLACRHESNVSALDLDLQRSLQSASRTGSLDYFILPEPNDFSKIPQSPANPLTTEKVELGKLLFFENCFGVEAKYPGAMQSFACGSCHLPTAGYRPGRHQGIADGGFGYGLNGEGRQMRYEYNEDEIDAQGARPLSVLNVAFVKNTMWNGSFGSEFDNVGTEHLWGKFDPGTAINHERLGNLEGQNIEGLKVHRMLFNRNLVEFYGYKAHFDRAFPDVPESERYTRKTASFAITAYLRCLLTTEAPFQKWLRGDYDAMTDEMKKGALLFFGKAGCSRCHYEANLGSNEFHALGVEDLFENGGLKTSLHDRRNLGRGGFTDQPSDMFKFRVPQLYNLGDGGPYFHGASKQTLEDVILYFNKGVKENPRVPQSQISLLFHPLNLSQSEMKELVEFVRHGLRDPNLKRYVPEKTLSGFCFPNSDPISRRDLGCN